MTTEESSRVWQRMRTLVLERHDTRRDVAAALGMSFIKVKALRQVAREPSTMRELTEHLAIDGPYTTLVVDDLERRGLVERTVHPGDRRRRIVTVTAAGREAAEVADRILNEPPAAFADLAAGELAELDRVMAKLADSDKAR
jgi:DNA-binding MarR family transcriptional regulator